MDLFKLLTSLYWSFFPPESLAYMLYTRTFYEELKLNKQKTQFLKTLIVYQSNLKPISQYFLCPKQFFMCHGQLKLTVSKRVTFDSTATISISMSHIFCWVSGILWMYSGCNQGPWIKLTSRINKIIEDLKKTKTYYFSIWWLDQDSFICILTWLYIM